MYINGYGPVSAIIMQLTIGILAQNPAVDTPIDSLVTACLPIEVFFRMWRHTFGGT